MSPQLYRDKSSAATNKQYAPVVMVPLERTRRLRIIVASGMLAVAGTSSAEPSRLWEEPYVYRWESTASSSGWQRFEAPENEMPDSGETTGHAISEIRRISGLTWEQMGQLFGVSRRSVHFWASGKPLNATNETRLMRALDVIRQVDRGDARSTRAALFQTIDSITPFDLLVSERFEEAQKLLGKGLGRGMIARTELSIASKSARQPLPLGELAEALHDRVHRDVGKGRAARTVRNKTA